MKRRAVRAVPAGPDPRAPHFDRGAPIVPAQRPIAVRIRTAARHEPGALDRVLDVLVEILRRPQSK